MITLRSPIVVLVTALFLSSDIKAEEKPMAPSNSEIVAKARSLFKDNQCFPKGGMGIVAKRAYVVLDSAKNELKLPDGTGWIGQAKDQREVVMIFEENVFRENQLPRDFRLLECTVISFEGDQIYFFNLKTFSGGFYKRQ